MTVQPRHVSPSECVFSKCGTPMNTQLTSPLTSVVVDGPPDASVEKNREERRTDNLVCPRCEREFACTEKSKWEQHCKRCTDD